MVKQIWISKKNSPCLAFYNNLITIQGCFVKYKKLIVEVIVSWSQTKRSQTVF